MGRHARPPNAFAPAFALRRAAVVGLLTLLAAALTQAIAVTAEPAREIARPRTLAARRALLENVGVRLAALFAKAKEDIRMARVDAYLALAQKDDFASPKRPHVAELVEFLGADDAPAALRERVRDALKSMTHRSFDPDLSMGEGQGRSKRAAFSREKLVPLLARGDEKDEGTALARQLVAEVLESYWHFPDPAIQRYNPKDATTWRKCVEAYKKSLQGR